MLTWVCSYCVRKRVETRDRRCRDCSNPSALLALSACIAADRAGFSVQRRCCSPRASRCCFVAGARLRYVAAVGVDRRGGVSHLLALTSPYRLKRLMVFLHPFDDPFQRRLSVDAVADRDRPRFRGSAWVWARSVQKLFYLPEAHTDFVFRGAGGRIGIGGRAWCVIALFVALVWRSFRISRMAAQAGLRFQAYVWHWRSASGWDCRPSSILA